jgi:formylglycine-generating enzyme required for sulfatase activity
VEPDVTIRRALLLALGEYGMKRSSPELRKAVLPKLQDIYRTAADPGLHAAAEWLLRQWQEEPWLKRVNEEWAAAKEQGVKRLQDIQQLLQTHREKAPPQWYVNGQGQTMVVIPGPVEFRMGSPPTEKGRRVEECQHQRRISRSFALAAKPVTKEQFWRFHPEFGHPAKDHIPDPTFPMGGVSWYDAAAYCNWLSKEEDIPKGQWCYETDAQGRVTRLKANYLSLTGYRLPTEAEWEYACRAGAATRWNYGQAEELLATYGRYMRNSEDQPWPVGSKKPNDLGLFDMHGNVLNWCQESYQPYPSPREGEITEDQEGNLDIVDLVGRVLRGGSFLHHARTLRCASRVWLVPTFSDVYVGFRPARTLWAE